MTSKTEKDQSEIHKYIWEKQLQHPQDTPEDMCARLKEDETFMSIFGRGTTWVSLQQYVLSTFEMILKTSGKFGRENRQSQSGDDLRNSKKNVRKLKMDEMADFASAYDESYWIHDDSRSLKGCDLSWLNWRDTSKMSDNPNYRDIKKLQVSWILNVEWSEDAAREWDWKGWLRCAYALTPFLTTCDPRHGIKIREMVNVEMFPDSDCLKRIMNVAEFSKDDRAMRYTLTSSFSSIASKCCIAALEEFRRLFLEDILRVSGCEDGSRVWGLPVVAKRDVFPPCEYDIDLILKSAHHEYFITSEREMKYNSSALDRATCVILRRAFILASYDGQKDNLRTIQRQEDNSLLAVWTSRWNEVRGRVGLWRSLPWCSSAKRENLFFFLPFSTYSCHLHNS